MSLIVGGIGRPRKILLEDAYEIGRWLADSGRTVEPFEYVDSLVNARQRAALDALL